MRVSGANKQQGFTLIEVLVALAVVALALTALLVLMGRQLDGSAYLRDKQIAQWVALNQLTLARLANQASNSLPEAGWSGQEKQAGRDWFYQVKPQTTAAEGVIKLEVSVSSEENADPLITVSGWLDRFHRSAP